MARDAGLCDIQQSVFLSTHVVLCHLIGAKKVGSLRSEKHLTSLERLDLCSTGVKILHSSTSRLSKLEWLNLEGLGLQNLPNEVSCLRSLTELWLSNCPIVTKLKLELIFNCLTSLQILNLKVCCNLSELHDNISSLSSLSELRQDGSSVEMLPRSTGALKARNCL